MINVYKNIYKDINNVIDKLFDIKISEKCDTVAVPKSNEMFSLTYYMPRYGQNEKVNFTLILKI